jgi:hypothetical protein
LSAGVEHDAEIAGLYRFYVSATEAATTATAASTAPTTATSSDLARLRRGTA